MSDIRIPRHKKYFTFEFNALSTFFIVINDSNNKSNLRTGSCRGSFSFQKLFCIMASNIHFFVINLYHCINESFFRNRKVVTYCLIIARKINNNEYEVLFVTEMKNFWALCTRDCLDQWYCNSFGPALRNQSYTSICKLWKDMLCS